MLGQIVPTPPPSRTDVRRGVTQFSVSSLLGITVFAELEISKSTSPQSYAAPVSINATKCD